MKKATCLITAPFFTRSGYGDLGMDIAKSILRQDKYELTIVPTRWGDCTKKNLEDEIIEEEEKEIFKHILKEPLKHQPELYFQVTIPNEFLMTPNGPQKVGKFNVGVTAGIETTVPRPEWLEGLNRMDLNLITSEHSKNVFAFANYNKKFQDGRMQELKVEKPMEVLFWGADTKVFKKTDKRLPTVDEEFSKVKEDFAFLFVGQWTGHNIESDRKNIGNLIISFLSAFKNSSKQPALVLKTSGAAISVVDRSECLRKINEIVGSYKAAHPLDILPNVYLLYGDFTREEMNAIYNHEKVKVHVSFTHGEGFGGPLLLSTLSGKPTITPKWSGHLDFLNPEYADFFQGELKQLPQAALNQWFVKEAKWFDVDYKKAEEKLKYYFYKYGEDGMLDKAESLRKENSEKFSVEAMDKKLRELIDKYVPEFAVEQPIILPPLNKIKIPKIKK